MRARRFAVDEQVEELEADGVALEVEPGRSSVTIPRTAVGMEVRGFIPLLELLDALDATLGVGDHLAEEVGEAGLADLGRLGAVEGPVVDGLATTGYPQPRLLARGRVGLEIGHGREGVLAAWG